MRLSAPFLRMSGLICRPGFSSCVTPFDSHDAVLRPIIHPPRDDGSAYHCRVAWRGFPCQCNVRTPAFRALLAHRALPETRPRGMHHASQQRLRMLVACPNRARGLDEVSPPQLHFCHHRPHTAQTPQRKSNQPFKHISLNKIFAPETSPTCGHCTFFFHNTHAPAPQSPRAVALACHWLDEACLPSSLMVSRAARCAVAKGRRRKTAVASRALLLQPWLPSICALQRYRALGSGTTVCLVLQQIACDHEWRRTGLLTGYCASGRPCRPGTAPPLSALTCALPFPLRRPQILAGRKTAQRAPAGILHRDADCVWSGLPYVALRLRRPHLLR